MSDRDLHAIVARAEGNAFFAEELMVATEMGGHGLPVDLADLLLVRLDRLANHPKQVVRAASCAGRRISHAPLSPVVEQNDEDLGRSLRAAVESTVLVQVGVDGYTFRHALLAKAVYDDLLLGERARIHAAYAKALNGGLVEGTAAELARHARAAHDLDTTLRASINAGADAMSVGGPDEAAQHYEGALALLSDHTREVPVDLDLIALVVDAAEAVTAAGHPQRAAALVEDQLHQLPVDVPAHGRVRLLLAMANNSIADRCAYRCARGHDRGSVADRHRANAAVAKLLSALALPNAQRGRDEEAARHATEALALAQKLDLPRVVAEFETARSQARLASVWRSMGRTGEARAIADTALKTARRLGAEPLLAELRQLGLSRGRDTDSRRDSDLTTRETEILGLVALGRSNGEIARQLFISVKTVSVHVSNILVKVGAGSRTEAAAIALRDGLLPS